jgi:hypothetical protein
MTKRISTLIGAGFLIVGLLLGSWPSAASGVEMFTNFNNGMELGFRPYGIPEFPPVRYHSWQPQSWYERHGVCRPSGDWRMQPPPSAFDYGSPSPRPRTAVPPPSVPGNQSQNEPIELRGEPIAGVSPVRYDDDADWIRGESFLPRAP